MIDTLYKQGVPYEYIRIIANLYSKSKVEIKLDKKEELFQVQRGMKQGDPLSLNIFNAVLEEIFRKIDLGGCEVKNCRRNT